MFTIRELELQEKELIKMVASTHMDTFTGFFLTFMGKGFLYNMYLSYCEWHDSGVLIAEKDGQVIGFLAYSGDLSGLYKNMIKKRLPKFSWYAFGAFLRRPSTFLHILSAFLKPSESHRDEKYVELASIGVNPQYKGKGVGSALISKLKSDTDFSKYAYITLETDAVDNEAAINFYEKNSFIKYREYFTNEKRKMIEYRFGEEK